MKKNTEAVAMQLPETSANRHETINVRDFVEAGDNPNNYYPAFQRALTAISDALDAGDSSGALLFVPPGNYHLSNKLFITRQMPFAEWALDRVSF